MIGLSQSSAPSGPGSLQRSTGSSFKPTQLGITPISEDPSKLRKAQSAPLLVKCSASLREARGAYGTMSAKARGAKVHNGPLELRPALPGRDCLSWVREDRQYSPYSYFENPNHKPSPKPAKSKGPPPLWLPPRAKDHKRRHSGDEDDMPLGAEAGEDDGDLVPMPGPPAGALLAKRPPWDTEHHVMFSRMNHEVQTGCREYFDRPVRKEGEGIPKVRELYAMNDRQCGWDDEPGPFGEGRHTLYNNIGPYSIGGCKEHQLPSYWRKVKDWEAFATDDSRLSLGAQQGGEKMTLLKTLADMPADQARDFWRGWAEGKAAPGSMPAKNRFEAPKGWDNRWNVCWSRANDAINQRQREYFSVPRGGTGLGTAAPRPRKSAAALGRAIAATDRFKGL